MFRVKLSLEKHVQQNIITTCFVLFVFVRGELVSNGVLIVSLLDALGFNSILNVMIASKRISNVVIANVYNHIRNDERTMDEDDNFEV